jgi:hypothetical protein
MLRVKETTTIPTTTHAPTTTTLSLIYDLLKIGELSQGKTFYIQDLYVSDRNKAQDVCENHGLQLASIQTKDEQAGLYQWAAINGVGMVLDYIIKKSINNFEFCCR